jgi:hypothetical protein
MLRTVTRRTVFGGLRAGFITAAYDKGVRDEANLKPMPDG